MNITILIISAVNFIALVAMFIYLKRKFQLESIPDQIDRRLENQLTKNQQVLTHEFYQLKETLAERFNHFYRDLLKSQNEEFEKLREVIEKNLDRISRKVRENLDEGFKNTNETFQKVIERLTKIDEAQKKIEDLSQNVVTLQDVLTDKKSRGIFGEVQLKQLLVSVFGEKNDKAYSLQYLLQNGKICDAIIFLPAPIGHLCVDSKFPLENYKKMMDQNLELSLKEAARKEFSRNLKKHIDDIANKYITEETSDQAILFLPAEAIFAEVHAYHPDIVDYAHTKRVWLTSPTTFLATLTTVQMILINLERNKYMNVIHQEINKLGDEFSRYKIRWDDLAKHIDTVSKDVKKIHTTSQKITDRFERIKEVEIEEISKESAGHDQSTGQINF